MFEISVGAHSCAMNSRLKAAPTTTILFLCDSLRASAVIFNLGTLGNLDHFRHFSFDLLIPKK